MVCALRCVWLGLYPPVSGLTFWIFVGFREGYSSASRGGRLVMAYDYTGISDTCSPHLWLAIYSRSDPSTLAGKYWVGPRLPKPPQAAGRDNLLILNIAFVLCYILHTFRFWARSMIHHSSRKSVFIHHQIPSLPSLRDSWRGPYNQLSQLLWMLFRCALKQVICWRGGMLVCGSMASTSCKRLAFAECLPAGAYPF